MARPMVVRYMPSERMHSPIRRQVYVGPAQLPGYQLGPAAIPPVRAAPQGTAVCRPAGLPHAVPSEAAPQTGHRLQSPVREPAAPHDLGANASGLDKAGARSVGQITTAASVTSTAPSERTDSAWSQPDQEHAPWSVDRTCLLSAAANKDQVLGRARLLDTSLGSVAAAVELLNRGIAFCPEDFCLAYSASNQAYYLLYRAGCMEKAFTHFNLPMGLSCTTGAPGSPAPSDDRQQAPAAQGRQQQLQTPRSRSLQDPAKPQGHDQAQSMEKQPETSRQEAAEGALGSCTEDTLDEGKAELEIGNRAFRLTKLIGQGAFGVVWKASELNGSAVGCEAAIKVMDTSTPEDLAMAVFEAELLRLLKAKLPQVSYDRVPQYISHSMAPNGGGGGTVSLAMSFIPGLVLDQWLYGICDEEHKHIDIPQIVRGRLPGSRMHSMPLAAACCFTANLLSQLAGVFGALQPIAFHRDLSPHNVLIESSGGTDLTAGAKGPASKPSFALIDFGLAVRSDSWHQVWNESNLAGDPRYWMPPAWMAFAFGFESVEAHPNRSFRRQYLGRIDHYSLGILGLEMLFALWDIEHRFDEQRAPGMLEAREAWCDFWQAVFALFQMFHMQGPEVTRQYLEHATYGDSLEIAELLRRVQLALRIAEADPANTRWAPLLHVLADLVDEHGVVEWAEIPAMLGAKRESGGVPLGKAVSSSNGCRARAAASVDKRGRSLERRAASPRLPEVTRYEVLQPAACACMDSLSSTLKASLKPVLPSTLQRLPSPPAQPSRKSPDQERGMHLFTQSLSPFSHTTASLTAPPTSGTAVLSIPPTGEITVDERQRSYMSPPTAATTTPSLASAPVLLRCSTPLVQSTSFVPPGAAKRPGAGQGLMATVRRLA